LNTLIFDSCEELGTVLSNDEVIDGKSERGGYPVVRKNMKQWSMLWISLVDSGQSKLSRLFRSLSANLGISIDHCFIFYQQQIHLITNGPSGYLKDYIWMAMLNILICPLTVITWYNPLLHLYIQKLLFLLLDYVQEQAHSR